MKKVKVQLYNKFAENHGNEIKMCTDMNWLDTSSHNLIRQFCVRGHLNTEFFTNLKTLNSVI